MPCKRCARKNRECGASYLSRDDPKSTQKYKIVFMNPGEFEEYQQPKKQKITPSIEYGQSLPTLSPVRVAKNFDASQHIEEDFLLSLPPSVGLEEPEMELFGMEMAGWI